MATVTIGKSYFEALLRKAEFVSIAQAVAVHPFFTGLTLFDSIHPLSLSATALIFRIMSPSAKQNMST
jgi:hypothetical protein